MSGKKREQVGTSSQVQGSGLSLARMSLMLFVLLPLSPLPRSSVSSYSSFSLPALAQPDQYSVPRRVQASLRAVGTGRRGGGIRNTADPAAVRTASDGSGSNASVAPPSPFGAAPTPFPPDWRTDPLRSIVLETPALRVYAAVSGQVGSRLRLLELRCALLQLEAFRPRLFVAAPAQQPSNFPHVVLGLQGCIAH